MEILAEAHRTPCLIHGDGDLVLLEDIYKDHSRSQDILVSSGATPVQDAGLQRANIILDETVVTTHVAS